MAKPKIEELTPEQDAVLDVVAAEYLAVLQRGDDIDMAAIQPALEMIYGFYDKPVPKVEIIDSPEAALMRARELGIPNPFFDWCGISDAGWLAHYEVFRRLKVLDDEETAELVKLQSFMFGGVYD